MATVLRTCLRRQPRQPGNRVQLLCVERRLVLWPALLHTHWPPAVSIASRRAARLAITSLYTSVAVYRLSLCSADRPGTHERRTGCTRGRNRLPRLDGGRQAVQFRVFVGDNRARRAVNGSSL